MHDTELFKFVKNGNLTRIKELVKEGADINIQNDDKMNFLHFSCRYGHLHIVKYLIEKNKNKLEYYISKFLKIFNLSFNYFDYINIKDDFGRTPLHLAVFKSNLEIVKYLVDNGADIYSGNNSPLMNAVGNGRLEIIKYLVEKGVNIHARNDDALAEASKKGHLEIVKYLIKNGADIHTKNDCALIWASLKNNFEIVKYLVEKGANIHAKNDEALKYASACGYFDIVKYLVEKGANINAKNNEALAYASINNHLKIVKYLIEKGANIHSENDLALFWAITKDCLNVVMYLVEKGSILHEKDENDLIIEILEYKYFETLEYLLFKFEFKKENLNNILNYALSGRLNTNLNLIILLLFEYYDNILKDKKIMENIRNHFNILKKKNIPKEIIIYILSKYYNIPKYIYNNFTKFININILI